MQSFQVLLERKDVVRLILFDGSQVVVHDELSELLAAVSVVCSPGVCQDVCMTIFIVEVHKVAHSQEDPGEFFS